MKNKNAINEKFVKSKCKKCKYSLICKYSDNMNELIDQLNKLDLDVNKFGMFRIKIKCKYSKVPDIIEKRIRQRRYSIETYKPYKDTTLIKDDILTSDSNKKEYSPLDPSA